LKKIIDEHGRVFGKISIIDFFVVLIVLLLAAGLYVKYNVLEMTSASSETGTITYSVTIFGVRDYTVKALKTSDAMYDKNNSGGYAVGTIADIKVSDAKKASEKLDGTVVLGNYSDHYDVTLTLTAGGAQRSGRYLVNKTYELNANSSRTFFTKFCTFEATIAEIS
jgi:hypothetical protein